MSSLGDAPLARKRGKKTAAQAEAESAKLTAKASQVERATGLDAMVPQMYNEVMTLSPDYLAAAFAELLGTISDVAWLRVIPLQNEGVTHWYVKWNKGKWANHYIYYGQRAHDSIRDAVTSLVIRFSEVERGERKPHRDARFSGH